MAKEISKDQSRMVQNLMDNEAPLYVEETFFATRIAIQ